MAYDIVDLINRVIDIENKVINIYINVNKNMIVLVLLKYFLKYL